MSSTTNTIILAGGGSGGHIAPGLAIAEGLRELEPNVRIAFLCSQRAIDRMMLDEADERYVQLEAQPFSANPIKLLKFYLHFQSARQLARELLRREGASCVVALGGFVAAPVMAAARDLNLPRVLVNLDDPPGKANRMMAMMGPRVLSAIDITSVRGFKHDRIGFPIRERTIAPCDAVECRENLGLTPTLPVLLVTGASQGASSINQMMIALVRARPEAVRGWQVMHLCGEEGASVASRAGALGTGLRSATEAGSDASPTPRPPPSEGGGVSMQLEQAYAAAGVPANVLAFTHEMGLAWGAAELAVSRAGANSVAEVAANCVPTVFLPYPHHKDQHQRRNAEPLERIGGAVIVEDHVDPRKNIEHAGKAIVELLSNEPRRRAMREALEANRPASASRDIAGIVLEMGKPQRR